MPGFNELGTPNTLDYVLGKGKLFFSENDPTTGLPVALRDLGNTPSMNVSIEVESREHKNSSDCLAQVDALFITSQKLNLSFQLDEINFENLNDFLSGDTDTYDNPHDVTHTDVIIDTTVELGRWYELRKATAGLPRVYNLDAVGVVYTIEKDGAPDVLLVEGTDYEIDEQFGLIFFKTTAVNIAAGNVAQWSITTGATTPQNLDRVRALRRALVEGTLVFRQDNANDCGQRNLYRFHRAQLTGDGELPLIGDEESVMSFTGIAGINSLVDLNSPLEVLTYEMT